MTSYLNGSKTVGLLYHSIGLDREKREPMIDTCNLFNESPGRLANLKGHYWMIPFIYIVMGQCFRNGKKIVGDGA